MDGLSEMKSDLRSVADSDLCNTTNMVVHTNKVPIKSSIDQLSVTRYVESSIPKQELFITNNLNRNQCHIYKQLVSLNMKANLNETSNTNYKYAIYDQYKFPLMICDKV